MKAYTYNPKNVTYDDGNIREVVHDDGQVIWGAMSRAGLLILTAIAEGSYQNKGVYRLEDGLVYMIYC